MRSTLPSVLLASLGVTLMAAQGLAATPIPSSSGGDERQADLSIVNGQVINHNQIDSFVQILTRDEEPESAFAMMCGATMIAPNWALTAAHCVWMEDENETIAAINPQMIGVYHPSSGQERQATQIVILPTNIDEAWDRDFALVKIGNPLPVSRYMPIAQPGLPLLTGGNVDIWGVGTSRSSPDESPELEIVYGNRVMRHASTTLSPQRVCLDAGDYAARMLCLGRPNPNMTTPMGCVEDDGGPITVYSDDPNRHVLVGVLGIPEDETGVMECGGHPLNSPSISAHANWVKQHVPEVTFLPYTADGNGRLQPPGPAPAPAPVPGPSQKLSCGDVESPGSQPPSGSSTPLRWEPMRGKNAGSEVSVVASRLAWSKEKPKLAMIAGECAWADALAATPLGDHAPLLLTDSQQLEAPVLAELQRLGVKEVLILGGEQAISPAVAQTLQANGMSYRRLAGASRLETAALMTEYLGKDSEAMDLALVARAYPTPGGSPSQAFADSLAAAPLAAINEWPIVLSETSRLSAASAQALRSTHTRSAMLIGGPSALSPQVDQDLKQLLGANMTNRITGASRADTAREISTWIYGDGEEGQSEPQSLFIVDGQADDAWKVGFTFASVAANEAGAYGLASGDTLAPETVLLIQYAKAAGRKIHCIASAGACAKIDSL